MNRALPERPLTLPSPPVGERVALGQVLGFRGSMREPVRRILSPSDGVRGHFAGLLERRVSYATRGAYSCRRLVLKQSLSPRPAVHQTGAWHAKRRPRKPKE